MTRGKAASYGALPDTGDTLATDQATPTSIQRRRRCCVDELATDLSDRSRVPCDREVVPNGDDPDRERIAGERDDVDELPVYRAGF